jgi:hypothetical protein
MISGPFQPGVEVCGLTTADNTPGKPGWKIAENLLWRFNFVYIYYDTEGHPSLCSWVPDSARYGTEVTLSLLSTIPVTHNSVGIY